MVTIFNRPECFQRLINVLSVVKPKKLYIAADGPRSDISEDYLLCEETKALINSISWNCDIQTLFRDKNLGCGPSMHLAIDWFFSNEKMGIILEDDIIPNIDFFYFCQNMLSLYADNKKIGMISGYNPVKNFKTDYDVIFSRNATCWGWASWKRSWSFMDYKMSWRDQISPRELTNRMGITNRAKIAWRRKVDLIDRNQVSAWDWQWYFSLSLNEKLTVFPRLNLVRNIGYGLQATHTKKDFSLSPTSENFEFPLKFPPLIIADQVFDRKFEKSSTPMISYLIWLKELIINNLKKLSF